jgi:fructokinase
VGVGFIALDVIEVGSDCYRVQAGGSVGNVQILLAGLGWQTGPIARLGDDAASTRLVADLERWSVRLDGITRSRSGSTPIIVQTTGRRSPAGRRHRFSTTCPRCGAALPRFQPISLAEARQIAAVWRPPQVLHFDLLSRSALALARRAANAGALIVFEPYHAGFPRLFREALALAHVVKYSRSRRRHLPGRLQGPNTLLEIETLGAEGVRYRGSKYTCGNRWQRAPAIPRERFVDAAGAGDWFTAGWLDRVGRAGRAGFEALACPELEAAIQHGQRLAAWNCGFRGARGGMWVRDWQHLAPAEPAAWADAATGDEPSAEPWPTALCPRCPRTDGSSTCVTPVAGTG